MSSVEERFRAKLKVCSRTGCWLWNGAINSGGYGSFRVDGKTQSAYRVSFELFKKPIPKNAWVLHTCDVRNCVNPAHLYLGDRLQNTKDMWDRKRNPNRDGENHHRNKLSNKQILEIRKRYVPRIVTQHDLATMYNVSQSLIEKIVNRKIWDHI